MTLRRGVIRTHRARRARERIEGENGKSAGHSQTSTRAAPVRA